LLSTSPPVFIDDTRRDAKIGNAVDFVRKIEQELREGMELTLFGNRKHLELLRRRLSSYHFPYSGNSHGCHRHPNEDYKPAATIANSMASNSGCGREKLFAPPVPAFKPEKFSTWKCP
jgi:hypothetical protein